ncbi:MAG TPA: hypothetical protein ENJ94_03990 [Gammaproteobacteria bacterium]|nr:hypothetical protein [Gammaproteobacteria bacterium]
MDLPPLTHEPPLYRTRLAEAETVNRALAAAFEREFGGPHMRQSHRELGRYENTWIAREAIPEAEPVLALAEAAAHHILGRDALRCIFWFNRMQPGDRTARHNHEEGGELLSGVYYVETPPACGDLLLYPAEGVRRVRPEAGQMLFFPPRLAHAVEANLSDRLRLSLAFNFGPAE